MHSWTFEPAKEPVHLKKFNLCCDSGAYSWYVHHFSDKKSDSTKFTSRYDTADYSITESAEFKSYLEGYIKFLLEHKDKFTFYVTLDVIGSPEKTQDILKYIESYGLQPIPVYHFGEDVKWLKQMIDNYSYIGISGLGRDISKAKYLPFGQRAFDIICDSSGKPRCKVHGFSMASSDYITRFPWYTCDATTWTALGRNGTVYVPRPQMKGMNINGWDYLTPPLSLPTTMRRATHDMRHADYKTPAMRKIIDAYFEMNGFTVNDAKHSYDVRDTLNMRFFEQMEIDAKKVVAETFDYPEGANIYLAGTPSGASSNINRFIDLLGVADVQESNWLGCYYYRKHFSNLMDIQNCVINKEDLRTAKKVIKKYAPGKGQQPVPLPDEDINPFLQDLPDVDTPLGTINFVNAKPKPIARIPIAREKLPIKKESIKRVPLQLPEVKPKIKYTGSIVFNFTYESENSEVQVEHDYLNQIALGLLKPQLKETLGNYAIKETTINVTPVIIP